MSSRRASSYALAAALVGLALLACSLGARGTPDAGRVEAMAEDVSPAPQAFSLVEVRPEQGDLVALLEAHAARAADLERRPFVEFSATWCPPCIALQRSLQDERMIEAFRGTYVIRLDIDEWEDHLAPAGFLVFGVPTFVEVDGDGRPTDRSLTGAAWGPDVPENMAPVLGEFFRGS